MSREQEAFGAMIFLKMQRNLKFKGKRKNERKITINSSGKRKVNWTPQILRAKETLQIKSPSPQESKTERCRE